ncbi:MAG: PilZ domain-containing protein [Phycisphaerae bacterium]
MLLSMDMTPRQTNRALEQALRTKALLEIEARSAPAEDTLFGTLVEREGNLLHVQLQQRGGTPLPANLVGSYCDVRLPLPPQLILFATCILDVFDATTPPRIVLAQPPTMQVANRRRFERAIVQPVEPLSVWSASAPAPRVGMLGDISGDGLLCHLPGREWEDVLMVGDPARVVFELPGHDEPFDLPVTVCNKTFSDEQNQLSVGLAFLDPQDDSTRRAIERLRAVLGSLMLTNLKIEVDGESPA